MKVLVYFEQQGKLKQSGIGRALTHQKKALSLANVDFTLNKNDSYDLAHINTLFSGSYRLLKKCHKKGMKVIVHGHSTKEDFRKSFKCWKLIAPIFNKMIMKMYKHADAIITPTNYSKGLIENYKGVKCPVYAISNGIMKDEYAYNLENVKAFDDFFKISNDKKIVICAGLYFERKGILDFFEVARKMNDVTFIWFSHLNKYITEHKILKAIKNKPANVYMPGYVDIKVLRGAFHRADCYFFPSYEENEGIAVLEAMASRLPIVVRDIGVFKDWLTDGVNCYKGNSNDEFILKIKQVFEKDNEELLNNADKVIEERTLDKIGNQLKDVYQKVYNSQN